MGDWQTIDTAPKDGTDILLAATDEDGSDWMAVGQWWVQAWGFMWTVQERPVRLCFEPTHWQPLPAPPAPPKDTRNAG